MIFLRFFILAFNVAAVTYLIYRLFQVMREPAIPAGRKIIIATAGVLLLLVPFAMFAGVMRPTMQYFLLYPVALSLFIYLIREVK